MGDDLSGLPRAELEQRLRTALHTLTIQREAAARGRRRTDPPGDDHMGERERSHGNGNGNGLDAGYKGVRVGAHGPLGILALMVMLVGGAAVFVNYRGFEDMKALLRQSSADHDLLACVVSLSPEDRAMLRTPGTTRWRFVELCPWLRVH